MLVQFVLVVVLEPIDEVFIVVLWLEFDVVLFNLDFVKRNAGDLAI